MRYRITPYLHTFFYTTFLWLVLGLFALFHGYEIVYPDDKPYSVAQATIDTLAPYATPVKSKHGK